MKFVFFGFGEWRNGLGDKRADGGNALPEFRATGVSRLQFLDNLDSVQSSGAIS